MKDARKEFDKHFNEVQPKKMVGFIGAYNKGELFAFDLRDGSDFRLTEEHSDDLLKMINSGDFIFGTEKKMPEVPVNGVDAIEVAPLIGLNSNGQTVDRYEDAENFEVCDEDDPNIIAWGVYVYREGFGATNLFDVVNREQAELAENVLKKLYNL